MKMQSINNCAQLLKVIIMMPNNIHKMKFKYPIKAFYQLKSVLIQKGLLLLSITFIFSDYFTQIIILPKRNISILY